MPGETYLKVLLQKMHEANQQNIFCLKNIYCKFLRCGISQVTVSKTDWDTFTKHISVFQSGAIARHLDLVSHGVRSKLDELKRNEIERLRQLVRIKMRQAQGTANDYKSVLHEGDLSCIYKHAAQWSELECKWMMV